MDNQRSGAVRVTMEKPFPENALRQIVEQTLIRKVEYFDRLESTSQYASRHARSLEHELPLVVLARWQTSGRGRGDRQWHASDGALTFTAMYGELNLPWDRQRWPQLSLVAAVAVAQTLQEYLPPEEITLKWPNDVFCRGRKICGILVEAIQGNRWMMNLGVGINVNNSLDGAPEDVRCRAISLADTLGSPIYLPEILLGVLTRFESLVDHCRAELHPILRYWDTHCWLSQKTITVRQGNRQLRGRCLGIDSQGRLLLENDAGTEVITSGEVIQF